MDAKLAKIAMSRRKGAKKQNKKLRTGEAVQQALEEKAARKTIEKSLEDPNVFRIDTDGKNGLSSKASRLVRRLETTTRADRALTPQRLRSTLRRENGLLFVEANKQARADAKNPYAGLDDLWETGGTVSQVTDPAKQVACRFSRGTHNGVSPASAVKMPLPGQSFNPSSSDHSTVFAAAVVPEIQKSSQSLHRKIDSRPMSAALLNILTLDQLNSLGPQDKQRAYMAMVRHGLTAPVTDDRLAALLAEVVPTVELSTETAEDSEIIKRKSNRWRAHLDRMKEQERTKADKKTFNMEMDKINKAHMTRLVSEAGQEKLDREIALVVRQERYASELSMEKKGYGKEVRVGSNKFQADDDIAVALKSDLLRQGSSLRRMRIPKSAAASSDRFKSLLRRGLAHTATSNMHNYTLKRQRLIHRIRQKNRRFKPKSLLALEYQEGMLRIQQLKDKVKAGPDVKIDQT